LVLVLLIVALLFQGSLILKNESEDVITVDKNVDEVASAAGRSKRPRRKGSGK